MAAMEIAIFFRRYPVDDRAFDYYAKSPPDVQERVLREFKPPRDGEGSYSGMLTAFVKRCRRNFDDQRMSNPNPHNSNSNAGAPASAEFASEPSSASYQHSHLESREHHDYPISSADPATQDPDMTAFRDRYPMDDRAFDFLLNSPEDVRKKVMDTFSPRRPDSSEFSAAITAYIRATRQKFSEDQASSGMTEEAIAQFFTRYPVDERCRAYFDGCPSPVRGMVLQKFCPRSEGDSNYSAAVTSFITRCRNDVDRRAPPPHSSYDMRNHNPHYSNSQQSYSHSQPQHAAPHQHQFRDLTAGYDFSAASSYNSSGGGYDMQAAYKDYYDMQNPKRSRYN